MGNNQEFEWKCNNCGYQNMVTLQLVWTTGKPISDNVKFVKKLFGTETIRETVMEINLECSKCHNRSTYRFTLESPIDGISNNKNKNRSRGWAFALFGGAIILIDICLSVVLLIYISTPEGVKNNQANGIVAPILLFACCVAPLIALGGWLLFLGIKRLRSPIGSA
jgi:hypothetical protein